MRIALPTLVLSLLAAARVFAQAGAVPPGSSAEMAPRGAVPSNIPVPPPSPPPELQQLKSFEGKWTCAGRVPVATFGPAHATKSAVSVGLELDGFWYSGSVDEETTPENPHPMHGKVHWTYDVTQRTFRSTWIDNSGGWATETTPGWKGTKMVWTGTLEAMGKKRACRDVFDLAPDGQLRHSFDVQMPEGWTELSIEVCKKTR